MVWLNYVRFQFFFVFFGVFGKKQVNWAEQTPEKKILSDFRNKLKSCPISEFWCKKIEKNLNMVTRREGNRRVKSGNKVRRDWDNLIRTADQNCVQNSRPSDGHTGLRVQQHTDTDFG